MFLSNTPFSEYLLYSRNMVETNRKDLKNADINPSIVLNANTPYELLPTHSTNKPRVGALLIHGLLDSPFTLREIGAHLQQQNILCRSVLLPGHGTHPEDLLKVTWQDWAATVAYGIESFRNEVDQLYLIGYSTGAALSIYHAYQNSNITGLILLSPAIKIKVSVDIIIGWQRLIHLAGKNNEWLCKEAEHDYAKYKSVPFHAVYQVCKLTDEIEKFYSHKPLNCPVLVAMSREDQTVSCQMALELFKKLPNPDSRFILYSQDGETEDDSRIIHRQTHYPELGIQHISHTAIPFSNTNSHYGQNGDYEYASHSHLEDLTFGAYNQVEVDMYSFMYKLGLIKKKRLELTYNPDFDYLLNQTAGFIR